MSRSLKIKFNTKFLHQLRFSNVNLLEILKLIKFHWFQYHITFCFWKYFDSKNLRVELVSRLPWLHVMFHWYDNVIRIAVVSSYFSKSLLPIQFNSINWWDTVLKKVWHSNPPFFKDLNKQYNTFCTWIKIIIWD